MNDDMRDTTEAAAVDLHDAGTRKAAQQVNELLLAIVRNSMSGQIAALNSLYYTVMDLTDGHTIRAEQIVYNIIDKLVELPRVEGGQG